MLHAGPGSNYGRSQYVQKIHMVNSIDIYYPGLFELEEGSVLYVRKRVENNLQDANLDVVVIWSVGGCVDSLLIFEDRKSVV